MNKAIIMVPSEEPIENLHLKITELAERDSEALVEPPPHVMETRGFVPVYEGGPKALTLERFTIWNRGINKRQVPASALKRETKIAVRKIVQASGRAPSTSKIAEIKSAILDKLLPRALIVETEHLMILNRSTGALYVDASEKLAETLISDIRQSLETLPMVPWIKTDALPRPLEQILSDWLAKSQTDLQRLALSHTAEVGIDSDRVRWKGHDLAAPEVRSQVEMGYQALSVELIMDGMAACTLGSDGAIKRLKLLNDDQGSEATAQPTDGATAGTGYSGHDAELFLYASILEGIHEELLKAR